VTGRDRAPRPVVSGLVLAGGRSSRFGSDKLNAAIDGRTLLERAVDAVLYVAERAGQLTALRIERSTVRSSPP
jgi:molybdopterin-guanine dinucleotide biosynthesis protein A